MAPDHEKRAHYALPHIRIEQFRRDSPYSPPPRRIDPKAPHRINKTHGKALQAQFSSAYAKARAVIAERRSLEGRKFRGVYVEIASFQHEDLGDLSWESKGIRLGALRVGDDDVQRAAIFVPEESEQFVVDRLTRYINQPDPAKLTDLSERFESVESVTAGSARSLWTDTRSWPEDPARMFWWECWTWADKIGDLEQTARTLDLQISSRRLLFPEVHVVPVHGTSEQIETLVFGSSAVEQLRSATDSPSFFTVTVRREQNPWVENLRSRITGPREDAPAVCLLDSGVAQAHPLISVALSQSDCLTIDPEWGSADSLGHGTKMAGTVLYDDLTHPLADQRTIELPFRLESVKFLPPPGFVATDPESYGSITQAAISTAELHAPERERVFCMAVTNKDVSGERPTSWSAALDQAASGAMVGDRKDQSTIGPHRLLLVSAGNIPDSSDPDDVSDIDEFPVEDPAQAWNVLTVGGFTEKVTIDEADGYREWSAVAEVGDLSPYSRISTDWVHSRTPIKPEVVFEAGNKAISPEQNEILSGLDSLSLLTTNRDFNDQNVTTFWATSPATAQAAGMSGILMARFPEFWPETVRALMIHSAEWTGPMLEKLNAAANMKQRIVLARHFGYGVPSLNRALASAENDLALLAQQEFTPFQRRRDSNDSGKTILRSPSFKQIDYYALPWPVKTLEQLGEHEVALKVTLSYFIEPSPNWDASLAPQRYQSFGLRFDLKRAKESEQQFYERVNAMDRGGDLRAAAVADEGWTFGVNSIAAGSVHCDVWRGNAATLAARSKLAIYPVGGWWRDRIRLNRHSSLTRYSLAVSISSEQQDVKLYTEIANMIAISTSV
jgi:Subtilase family